MALIDKYTKEEIETIVKSSYSQVEVIDKLGYGTHNGSNSITVKKRIDKYNIDCSHFTHCTPQIRDEGNVFCDNSTASRATLRRWYVKGNYSDYLCSICGMLPQWNGKPLTQILDHINGHNHDNRIENLRWVCPNCNQQLETTGFKKMRVQDSKKIKKKYFCKQCGAFISKQSRNCLCPKCFFETRRVVDRPSRDELKQLIRSNSFLSIGKKYGVSDKAVSKWCKYYDLPYRVKDIKNILDTDWEKI